MNIKVFQRGGLGLVQLSITVMLAACGGGGSTSTSSTGTSSTGAGTTAVVLSGTAAAGLPLVGTVTVKDSTGATKSVVITADALGAYSVDVTGMKAPLMLRAQGSAGGTEYVVHSALASADASGTVNITPLTDLIVSNVAGQLAKNYFNSGSFAGLTASDLAAESSALKAKLLPVLSAMNVDASIDLMRTPFTPLSSALDKALDVIRISTDAGTNVATITNLINQIQITDSINARAAAESSPPTLSASGLSSAASDLTAVRQSMTDFFALFASGLPASSAVSARVSANFLQNDTARTAFASSVAGASDLVGATPVNVVVRGIDYAYSIGGTPSTVATIDFSVKDKTGTLRDGSRDMKVVKEADGVWRLLGNQRVLEVEVRAHAVNNQKTSCKASGLEFDVMDQDSSNSGNVSYVVIAGAGLPAGGLRYNRNTQGGRWQPVGTPNPYWYPMTETCANSWAAAGIAESVIAAIPSEAVYTFTAYDAANVKINLGPESVYKRILTTRPFTLAELGAVTFPSFTPTPALAGFTGGTMSISGTTPFPEQTVWVYLGVTSGSGLTSQDQDLSASSAGAFTKSYTMPAFSGSLTREIRVGAKDSLRRSIMTTRTD
jgi:hypothetical protein